MADIEIRRTHGMGYAEAKAAAHKMAEHLGKRFGLRGDWRGDTLAFTGTGVTGTLDVDAQEVHLAVSLGFLLRAMKGSIEQAVHGELDKLFAAAPTARKPATKAPAKPAAKPAPKARTAATSRKKGA